MFVKENLNRKKKKKSDEIFTINVLHFSIEICFLTKSLTLGISFLTTLRAAVVPKPAIVGISPLISLTLALQSSFLTTLLVSVALTYLTTSS